MPFIYSILHFIDHTTAYRVLLYFYGIYPVFMACIWVVLSVFFFFRRDRQTEIEIDDKEAPFVSVVIAAYNEEVSISKTLDALLELQYPAYEVIVVDEGSTDKTSEIIQTYTERGPIRLVKKEVNEGKAMALNDALPVCRGEIFLLIDADIIVTPDILRHMVPHFRSGRVAAVTGNPRVANRGSL